MAFNKRKQGFTIVELMIAVTVFSTAMVLVLAGVIVIARQYQHASNKVALEEATRTVHQQITDSIKFSGEKIDYATSGSWQATCIGNLMYIYSNQVPYVFTTAAAFDALNTGLWVKSNTTSCSVGSISTSGANNLLPDDAKVTRFSVNDVTGEILTTFVKSPGDLLQTTPATPGEFKCDISKPGREFCAAVSQNSFAFRRVD